MQFSIFSNMYHAAEIATEENFAFFVDDPHTKAVCEEVAKGNKERKKDLPCVCWHATFKNGKRKNEEAISSGLYMLDLDHIKDAYETGRGLTLIADSLGIYVIHVTPSGEGLRIVAKAKADLGLKTIADYQKWLANKLLIPEYDESTKDLARLSYLVPRENFIYFNPKVFTDEKEIDLVSGQDNLPHHSTDNCSLEVSQENQPSQKDYRGISFERIAAKYFELNGGEPHEGERNSKLYNYARQLRYLCDFKPEVMLYAMPTYGLSKQEVRSIVAHALESTRASRLPQSMKDVLNALDSESTETESVELKMPKVLPPVIEDFVNIAPSDFKTPSVMACLPVLGTVFTHLRSQYLDGNMNSPSLMCLVEAPQASGKSFTRRIVDICLQDIINEDDIARAKEQAYREQLRMSKNKKEQPTDPRAVVRVIPASVSIAKLLQRLDYAEGKHLFSFSEELDTLIKSNKAGAWSQKSDIYRNAFDNAVYGQDYISDSTYSANLRVYYNILVCGTPASVSRFFSNAEDGLVSRFIFCELKDQFGMEMPVFKQLSEPRIAKILATLRECQNLAEQVSELKMPLVRRELKKWLENQRLIAIREVSQPRDIFRRRAAVIGFRAAMIAYALFKFDKKHERYAKDLAIFVANYVLNTQMRKFGEGVTQGSAPQNFQQKDVFKDLEQVFTSEDVAARLRKARQRTPAKVIISIWKANKLIEKIDKNKFQKVKL